MKIEKDKYYQYTNSNGIIFLIKALENKEDDNSSTAGDEHRWLGVCVKCSDSDYMKPGYSSWFGLREYWKEVNHNVKSIYDDLKDLLTF